MQNDLLCDELDEATNHATTASAQITTQATIETNTTNEALQKRVTQYAHEFLASSDVMEGKLSSNLAEVHVHVDQSSRDIHQSEQATSHYVKVELKRDTTALPPHKTYTFPTQYAATAPYEKILTDQSVAWNREHGINTGAIQPGKPAGWMMMMMLFIVCSLCPLRFPR